MSSSDAVTLAVDAHGGDHGPVVTVPAAAEALRRDPRLAIVLVGREGAVGEALRGCRLPAGARLTVRDASTVLPADAKPAAVLRRGADSSMWRALALVADGHAGACVSAGSTAALMTLGVKLVGMLPGIQRPALMARFSYPGGQTGMLDLGANLRVGARQLVQFAVMGTVKTEVADGIERPRVGLLNVGHEDGKGDDVVRTAHAALKALPLNYVGFIEGYDIFSDRVDVAVCEGFAGNLVLKSSEGLARVLEGEMRRAFSSTMASRLGSLLAGSGLRRLLASLDPSEHNGAPLLGLNRVVVKSHGGADCRAMTRAILEAGREARRGLPGKIEASIRAFKLETDA